MLAILESDRRNYITYQIECSQNFETALKAIYLLLIEYKVQKGIKIVGNKWDF